MRNEKEAKSKEEQIEEQRNCASIDPRKHVFCTLLSDDTYLAGVQVLAYSINKHVNRLSLNMPANAPPSFNSDLGPISIINNKDMVELGNGDLVQKLSASADLNDFVLERPNFQLMVLYTPNVSRAAVITL
jgi:hypothetical protein